MIFTGSDLSQRLIRSLALLVFLAVAASPSVVQAGQQTQGTHASTGLEKVEYILQVIERGEYTRKADMNEDGRVDLQDLDLAVETYERSTNRQPFQKRQKDQ